MSSRYESTGPKGSKTEHLVTLGDGPLMLAGVYDYNGDLDLLSFTAITTEPGPFFRQFHHRVPGILPDAEAIDGYLTGTVEWALVNVGQSTDALLVVDPPVPA